MQRNRIERLEQILLRDGSCCVWCGRPFGPLIPPTTDHLVPQLKGGPSWVENEVAACRRCNSQRGHQSPSDWAQSCRQRGWAVELSVVKERLKSLDGAIQERGGQRRARTYVDHQLRRLADC